MCFAYNQTANNNNDNSTGLLEFHISKYHIAIVGSGPAGLSAAARAAYHDQQAGRAEPVFRIRALLMSGNNPKAAVCCRLV